MCSPQLPLGCGYEQQIDIIRMYIIAAGWRTEDLHKRASGRKIRTFHPTDDEERHPVILRRFYVTVGVFYLPKRDSAKDNMPAIAVMIEE